jgi:hypothetical protein
MRASHKFLIQERQLNQEKDLQVVHQKFIKIKFNMNYFYETIIRNHLHMMEEHQNAIKKNS